MSSPIEQIKERLNIVDLIRSYVKLEKAGANFKATCPFHAEKNPSFFVSPARQMWHCFSCNKGGDHFQFIQDLEGIEFPEALRVLAERAGVTLKREDPRARSERTNLLSLLNDAASFYEVNLASRKDVGEYLKARGLTGVTAKQFRIGYAVQSWDSLLNHLKGRGYRESDIEKAGLVIKKDDGGYYDRFRARIMFPLFDGSDRIVGFSGRIFEQDAEGQKDADAKYINTPQTVLYDKSKILYGLHRAKDEMRKTNTAILVEGQMDVLLSHQAGMTNAVAVSGTSFSEHHAGLLKRFSSTLLLSFDRDEAGFKAADRSIRLALSEGFDVQAIVLPQGKDPADVIQDSAEMWKKALIHPVPVITFLMDALLEQVSGNQSAYLASVRERVLPYIASIAGEMNKAYWVKDIAKRLALDEDAIWREVRESIPLERLNDTGVRKHIVSHSRKDSIEERLLGILAWKGRDDKGLSSLDISWFSEERRRHAASLLAGTKPPDLHYIKKLALEAELAYQDSSEFAGEVNMLVASLEKEYTRSSLETLASDIRRAEKEGPPELLQKKMDEFKELSRKLLS